MGLVWTLLIGALAGWLAGVMMKGRGFGILGNIVIGIIGAFLGSYTLGLLGVSMGGGVLGLLLTSVIGAVLLLFVVGILKRA